MNGATNNGEETSTTGTATDADENKRAVVKKKARGKGYILTLWKGVIGIADFFFKEGDRLDEVLALKVDGREVKNALYEALARGDALEFGGEEYELETTPFESDDSDGPTGKKRKLTAVDDFHSPLLTRLPLVFEDEPVEDFLAPERWLEATALTVLQEANRRETNDPRVSPVALVRCSRGGKTRSMTELAQEVRRQDPSYGIVFVSFNTDTPLKDKKTKDPTGELCVRIAFTASKDRQVPGDLEGFMDFYESHKVTKDWVVKWLGRDKCILFVDELNMLEECICSDTADFIKENFLLPSGRGVVFSSHVAAMSRDLVNSMSSPSDRKAITVPLPIISSVREARDHLGMALSAQDALFLGMLPGLIVEKKRRRQPRERRVLAVSKYLGTIQSEDDVCMLLRTLLTGDAKDVDRTLQELMTADLADDGETMILRWVPFHMQYVMEELSSKCTQVRGPMKNCVGAVADLFRQFPGQKWESGDAWEALFLIVLIVPCLTGTFDENVLPLGPFTGENNKVVVDFNEPFNHAGVDFVRETNAVTFVDGIPNATWGSVGNSVISIYYPRHARFEAYDMIVAVRGNRSLFGYQLKEGSEVPSSFTYNNIFEQSYLIRGKSPQRAGSVRLWRSVPEGELRDFFGVSARQWSADHWRRLTAEDDMITE